MECGWISTGVLSVKTIQAESAGITRVDVHKSVGAIVWGTHCSRTIPRFRTRGPEKTCSTTARADSAVQGIADPKRATAL